MAAPAAPSLAISNAPPRYADVAALRAEAAANMGAFGGAFIPETLVAAHEELERIYVECTQDAAFARELERLGRDYVGRPTPLYHAARLSAAAGGGAQIWLKREELAFTGSHKINNALGQALVAKRIGKPRVIAETGAGQHGVATATACALLGLECVVYMGADDVQRQSLNVFRMKMCAGGGGARASAHGRARPARARAPLTLPPPAPPASVRPSSPSRRARARSRTRSTRRCATG